MWVMIFPFVCHQDYLFHESFEGVDRWPLASVSWHKEGWHPCPPVHRLRRHESSDSAGGSTYLLPCLSWVFLHSWQEGHLDADLGGAKETCQMGSRSTRMKRQFWGQKEASLGHAWACLAVDKVKATQQGAALVWCRCGLGCTRYGAC